ncbi:MAG TPA: UdgX family uracil-DNA binding protein [Labilithrix sp.]|nr:UdgX family uracil-DNA binding protein [Labilithrix sp.]
MRTNLAPNVVMEEKPSPSLAYVPAEVDDHEELVIAAQGCQACDLYKRATQVVFGEGPVPAAMMLVGEQPGDREDLTGRPFVGPAGRLLDDALEEAEIPRDEVYVTNAVKHFKWEPRGKRRLHSKPNAFEIHACRGWLESEIALVRPEVIVCLGATAAQVFFGRAFRLTKSRGELQDGAPWATRILATFHPSALLRMKTGDADEYARVLRAFTLDLAEAASVVNFRARRVRRARTRPSASL